jgi:hypothetical protein
MPDDLKRLRSKLKLAELSPRDRQRCLDEIAASLPALLDRLENAEAECARHQRGAEAMRTEIQAAKELLGLSGGGTGLGWVDELRRQLAPTAPPATEDGDERT